MDAINLVGLVLTSIGTLITAWQAWVARKAATKSEDYYRAVKSIKNTLDLDTLRISGDNAREVCRRLRTMASGARGVNVEGQLKQLEDFCHSIDLHKTSLVGSSLVADASVLKVQIRSFREAKNPGEMQEVSQEMFDGCSKMHADIVNLFETQTLPVPKK